jgi:hypothetical protein
VTSTSPPSELDVYLSLVSLLNRRALPEAAMQLDCRTRSSDGPQEYLVYASRAARLILAERLQRDLCRSLDVARSEWVFSVEEARTIASYRLW